jgi:hypothetical protein
VEDFHVSFKSPDINCLPLRFLADRTELDVIHLLETRLYLRIFYFFDSTDVEHRRNGILKAYSSATEFIALANSSHAIFNYLSYSPISSLKFLGAALAILIQVLTSNLCVCVDYAAGVASLEAGLAALRHSSIEDNDVFIRAAEIMSYIWRMSKEDPELKKQSPTLLIKSRLSASLLFDGLWKWRQYHIKSKTLDSTSKYFMIGLMLSGYRLMKIKGSAGSGGMTNDDPGMPFADGQAMDWTLFDNSDWLWEFDNIPMPGADILG